MNVSVDGNFAGNPTALEAPVRLDVVRPIIDLLTVKNGAAQNLLLKMTRTKDASGDTLEDGIVTRVGLKDPQKQSLLFEGPHDTQFSDVLSRSNVEGFANADLREVCVMGHSHMYGNAQFALRVINGASAHDLRLEGARLGELLLAGTASYLWDCFLFNGGGADGSIGVVLGEEGSGVFDNKLYNFRFKNLLKVVRTVSNNAHRNYISGHADAEEGQEGHIIDLTAPQTLKADNDLRDLHAQGSLGMADNSKCRIAETTFGSEGIHAGRCQVVEVTAAEHPNFNFIQFGEVGQRITLFFTGNVEVKVTGNIRLAGSVTFNATANDTLSLVLRADGNWYETGRAVI